MNKKIVSLVASLPVGIIAPLLAFAQATPPIPPATPAALKSLGAFRTFVCTIVFGWFFTFLIVLAVIFGLVSAYKYLTAGGDPEKVKAASNVLIYAAISIVVALFARGLPYLVSTLMGGTIGAGLAC